MQPDTLAAARAALRALRDSMDTQCEETRVSEESPPEPGLSSLTPLSSHRRAGETTAASSDLAYGGDPFERWRASNAAQLTVADLAAGHDPGGFCAAHRRVLSYPEQKRGACSWCVPVDPEREPEYWASHWRRFTEGR
jgi:hypothetical protein